MSRGYRVLAIAIVGVLVLVGLARLVGGSEASTSAAATTDPAMVSVAPTSSSVRPVSTVAAVPVATAPVTTAPTTTAPATAAPVTVMGQGCTTNGASAVVDREAQQAWLCRDGAVVAEFPITSAWTMPDPGTYPVYAKDMNASSNFGGHRSTMTHFVAFSYGKNTGARVAFHSVPVLGTGEFVQPLESVGDLSRRGESSGCIRVLPDDAIRIWDTLALGDSVVVLN